MSDLVERVMTAINTCDGHDDEYRRRSQHEYVDKAARAAIDAVAKWISTRTWQPTCRGDVVFFIREQLEDKR